MSQGPETVVFNTYERAVSTDLNRLQVFQARILADMLRYSYDARAMENEAGGVAYPLSGTAAPPSAAIVGGIMARPEMGTTAMFIDPGVICIADTDLPVDVDASPYKVISDPGILTAGTLALTANTSGYTRIDIVECQRAADQVIESDSRDLYDPQTDLFTAATVTKAKADKLTYRIRKGTPGLGFPGVVSGWLPLAVCRVPNGASDWNAVDLWDVRPMASDLLNTPFDIAQSTYPRSADESRDVEVLVLSAQTAYPYNNPIPMIGNVDLQLINRKIGGKFAVDGSNLDLNNVDILEPTFYTDLADGIGGAILSKAFYVWLVCPHGLPRWVKYSPWTAGYRKPLSLRGLPVLSCAGPDANGFPIRPLQLPIGLAMPATYAYAARMAFAGMMGTRGGAFLQPLSGRMTGHEFYVIGPEWNSVPPYPVVLSQNMPTMFGCIEGQDTSHTTVYGVFGLIDNITHPMNAKNLKVRIGCRLAPPSGSAFIYMVASLSAFSINLWKYTKSLSIGRRDAPPPSLGGGMTVVTASAVPSLLNITFHQWQHHSGTTPAEPSLTRGSDSSVVFVDVSGCAYGDKLEVDLALDVNFYYGGANTPVAPDLMRFSVMSVQDVGGVAYSSQVGANMRNVVVQGGLDTMTDPYGVIIGNRLVMKGILTITHAGLCHLVFHFNDAGNAGDTITINGGSLVVKQHHWSTAIPETTGSAAQVSTPTLNLIKGQISEEIDHIPLGRNLSINTPGGYALQVCFDGYPSLEPETALSTNPELTTTAFTLDVVGWEL